jgi:AcrR family transcriptional regulator
LAAELKWRRRKAARPGEIVAAALVEFADNGFANAKLDTIAQRAGITKAALYRYFDSKEALFRAAAVAVIAPNLTNLAEISSRSKAPIADLLPTLLADLARSMSASRLPSAIRLVISEARAFPDLAEIWHDAVLSQVLDALGTLLAKGQERGEIVVGDPRLMAFSLAGPLLMGALVSEVFAQVAGVSVDLEALAVQHARLFLGGAAIQSSTPKGG